MLVYTSVGWVLRNQWLATLQMIHIGSSISSCYPLVTFFVELSHGYLNKLNGLSWLSVCKFPLTNIPGYPRVISFSRLPHQLCEPWCHYSCGALSPRSQAPIYASSYLDTILASCIGILGTKIWDSKKEQIQNIKNENVTHDKAPKRSMLVEDPPKEARPPKTGTLLYTENRKREWTSTFSPRDPNATVSRHRMIWTNPTGQVSGWHL